jgi:hypothetical protein
MLQSDLTRLIQLLTGTYAPTEEEVLREVSEILASVSELSRTAQRMLSITPRQELERIAEEWFFYDEFPRSNDRPSTEFVWACDYTASSMVLLRRYVLNNMAIGGIVRNIQMIINLWDMREEWPDMLPDQDPNLEVRITGLYTNPSHGFR